MSEYKSAPVIYASSLLSSALDSAMAGDFFGAGIAYAEATEWARSMQISERDRAGKLLDFVHEYIDGLQREHVDVLRDGGE